MENPDTMNGLLLVLVRHLIWLAVEAANGHSAKSKRSASVRKIFLQGQGFYTIEHTTASLGTSKDSLTHKVGSGTFESKCLQSTPSSNLDRCSNEPYSVFEFVLKC